MNLESSQFWIAAQEAEIMQTHAAHFSYVRLIIEAKVAGGLSSQIGGAS